MKGKSKMVIGHQLKLTKVEVVMPLGLLGRFMGKLVNGETLKG